MLNFLDSYGIYGELWKIWNGLSASFHSKQINEGIMYGQNRSFQELSVDALCQQKPALQANHTKAIHFTKGLCQKEAMNFSRSYSSPYREKKPFQSVGRMLIIGMEASVILFLFTSKPYFSFI